jgi:hypothetical protein
MKLKLIIITTFAFLYGCSNYCEYTPVSLIVERGDHKLVETPELSTKDHIEALKHILNKYNEPYMISDDKLLIKESLQKDKDLLQNYTFKAEVLRKSALTENEPKGASGLLIKEGEQIKEIK